MPESGFLSMLKAPTHIRGALLSGVVCAVWIFLAQRSPDLHYHFAPLIAGAVWPLSLRSAGQRSVQDTAKGAAGAVVLTLATTIGILATDNMNGPNFLHEGPAWPEAVLFAVLGALIGLRTTSRARPGMLGSLIDTTT